MSARRLRVVGICLPGGCCAAANAEEEKIHALNANTPQSICLIRLVILRPFELVDDLPPDHNTGNRLDRIRDKESGAQGGGEHVGWRKACKYEGDRDERKVGPI